MPKVCNNLFLIFQLVYWRRRYLYNLKWRKLTFTSMRYGVDCWCSTWHEPCKLIHPHWAGKGDHFEVEVQLSAWTHWHSSSKVIWYYITWLKSFRQIYSSVSEQFYFPFSNFANKIGLVILGFRWCEFVSFVWEILQINVIFDFTVQFWEPCYAHYVIMPHLTTIC